MSIRLLVIAGPTACGKTRLGVEVAHALGSEVVSADSRQVYRGLDIGSGKDLEEYRRVTPPVRHHLIDVADPGSIYSVFHYQQDCYRLLRDKHDQAPFRDGVPLLMVGGTGLYIESVLKGYRIANVPEDVELRRRLMQRELPDLVRQLASQADPALLERTDASSKKRVVRAIEIARHARCEPVRYSDPPPVEIEHAVFCVRLSTVELHRRIDLRLEQRLEQGLVAEVRGLLEQGIEPARMTQLGLEYREVAALLRGEKTEARMRADLRRGIRQFAKRQRTWFGGLPRRGLDVTWIDPGERDRLLGHAWRPIE